MFSAKPTILIVLRAKSLEFYNGHEEEKEILDFPPKVLKKDNIVDWEKFEMLIEEFLARNSLKKQHAIMVLSKDILFEKTIPNTTVEIEAAETQKYLKKIPYDEKDIVTKKLKDEQNTYLVSTYKDFYQSIKYILEKFGWMIEQVVPITMFEDFDSDKTFDYAEVNLILSNRDMLKVGDMTSEEDTVRPSRMEQVQNTNEGLFTKHNIFLLVGIAAVCAGIFFAILYFNILSLPKTLPGFAQPTPTPLPTSTPTPTPAFDKASLSVSVLNGTGTPGQAGQVKSIMSGMGYSTIETGNADSTDTTTTTVVFSNKVPKNIQEEIISELEKTTVVVVVSVLSALPVSIVLYPIPLIILLTCPA
jgi:hypothetical protein